MEQTSLIDSALRVVFYDNDLENGRHSDLFRGLYTLSDLEFAFATVEAHSGSALDCSFDRTVHNLARRSVSTSCELVEIARAVNRLRRSSGVEYLTSDEVLQHFKGTVQKLAGHKRKYDELLADTERKERQRAQIQWVTQIPNIMLLTIYGPGSGLFNRLSIQEPLIIRMALTLGCTPVLAPGTKAWNHIHIADLAALYEALVVRLLRAGGDRPLPHGRHGIYFAKAGEHMARAVRGRRAGGSAARRPSHRGGPRGRHRPVGARHGQQEAAP